MKYSLAEIIGETHSRRVDSFFSICFSLCNFLEEQHNSGVVLKNFCPDLIFIDFQNNKAQLCSRPLEKDEILPYISPEQTGRINRQVDYRSDFYSLGAILSAPYRELPFMLGISSAGTMPMFQLSQNRLAPSILKYLWHYLILF